MDDNEQILRKLINEYGDDILRLCILYMNDYHTAEDAWQETFIMVYKNLYRLSEISSIKPWICKIAVNTCRTLQRKTAYRRHNELIIDDITEDTHNDIILCENHLLISKAVNQLSSKLKEVIILHYLHDFSANDISSILGIRIGTVLVRLQRGREKLKEILKEDFVS